jgi:hypothetical protein
LREERDGHGELPAIDPPDGHLVAADIQYTSLYRASPLVAELAHRPRFGGRLGVSGAIKHSTPQDRQKQSQSSAPNHEKVPVVTPWNMLRLGVPQLQQYDVNLETCAVARRVATAEKGTFYFFASCLVASSCRFRAKK